MNYLKKYLYTITPFTGKNKAIICKILTDLRYNKLLFGEWVEYNNHYTSFNVVLSTTDNVYFTYSIFIFGYHSYISYNTKVVHTVVLTNHPLFSKRSYDINYPHEIKLVYFVSENNINSFVGKVNTEYGTITCIEVIQNCEHSSCLINLINYISHNRPELFLSYVSILYPNFVELLKLNNKNLTNNIISLAKKNILFSSEYLKTAYVKMLLHKQQ